MKRRNKQRNDLKYRNNGNLAQRASAADENAAAKADVMGADVASGGA